MKNHKDHGTIIQQFRKAAIVSFYSLVLSVKRGMLLKKNQEIKDLYENLQYKDKNIQELKEKLAKKRAGNSGSQKKEAEKYRKKTEAASRKQSSIGKKKKHTNSGRSCKKVKRRLLGIASCLGKKYPKVLWKILEYNLCPAEQLENRQCVENEVGWQMQKSAGDGREQPFTGENEKMQKEIILLMRNGRWVCKW